MAKGDENLSAWAQNQIVELTRAYYKAKTQAERDRILAEQEAIRNNPANYVINELHNKDNEEFYSLVNNILDKRSGISSLEWSIISIFYKKSTVEFGVRDRDIIEAYDLINAIGKEINIIQSSQTKIKVNSIFPFLNNSTYEQTIENSYTSIINIHVYLLSNNNAVKTNEFLSRILYEAIENGIGIESRYSDYLLEILNENSYYKRVWENEKNRRIKEYGSALLDLAPVIGDIKAGVEVIIGKDLITGREISWKERTVNGVLLILPIGLDVLKDLKKSDDLSRLLSNSDEIAELTNKLDDVPLGITGTSNAAKGIDSITGQIPKDKPVVVIGESMGRVNPVAEQLKQAGFDVKTYNPKNFRSSLGNLNRLDVEANRSWIRYWTQNKGATVIDIGIDPSRTARSPFYGVEYRSIYQNWNYPNVIKYNP